jgi:DNA processing protein
VLAGGVDVIYPEENADLTARIAVQGCLVSEQPMGCVPQTRHFPLRNRIVSGLVRAVVVVEAASRSGSLITARTALDQGRDVLAVPGHPFDARAAGCNMLIRDGAVLVRSAEDVLEAIGGPGVVPVEPEGQVIEARVVATDAPGSVIMAATGAAGAVGGKVADGVAVQGGGLPGPVPARRPLVEMAALHGEILDRLGPSAVAEDQLIRDLDLPTEIVARELVALEMEGRVLRQAGGLLSRC